MSALTELPKRSGALRRAGPPALLAAAEPAGRRHHPLWRVARGEGVYGTRRPAGRDVPVSRVASGVGDACTRHGGPRPAVGRDGPRVGTPAGDAADEPHGLD